MTVKSTADSDGACWILEPQPEGGYTVTSPVLIPGTGDGGRLLIEEMPCQRFRTASTLIAGDIRR